MSKIHQQLYILAAGILCAGSVSQNPALALQQPATRFSEKDTMLPIDSSHQSLSASTRTHSPNLLKI